MPTSARHIIQRQTVWLDTPDQQLSFGLQERVSAYCRQQLPTLLETIFDRHSDNLATIRLDQLTIDAGQLSIANLESELTRQINQQLDELFGQISGQTGPISTNGYGRADKASPVLGHVERISRETRLAQLFRYFLQNGRLPVWADSGDFDQSEGWLTTPSAASFRLELRGLLRANPALVNRLIYHSSDQVLIWIAFESDAEASDAVVKLLLEVSQTLAHRPVSTLREMYWQAVLLNSFRGRQSFSDSLILLHNALTPTEARSQFFRQLLSLIELQANTELMLGGSRLGSTLGRLIEEERKGTGTTVLALPDSLPDMPASEASNHNRHTDTDAYPSHQHEPAYEPAVEHQLASTNATAASDPVALPNTQLRSGTEPMPRQPSNGKSAQATTRPTNDTSDESELFVSLAGLVLLHPFLVPLFSEMGLLTTNRQWIDEAAAARGVQMLTYLATGHEYYPEYAMTLPKLLCGLPFETVVSPNLALTDTDQQQATELLDAVISHWKALGTVSPDGLREGFLQRAGKLTTAEPGWRLTVERKTLDILLNQLPWGYSTIKTPFMTDILFVDWV